MIVQALMIGMIGLMIFVAAPLVVQGVDGTIGALRGKELGAAEGLADAYRSMAITAFDKLVLVRLRNAGWRLRSFSYKSSGKIQAKVGGKSLEWWDPKGRMGRLRGRPFGIAHEEIAIMGGPADAHIGEKFEEQQKKRGGCRTEVSGRERWYNRVGFDNYEKAVDFDAFPKIVQGSVDPQAGQRTKAFKEKAFAKFNSTNLMDYGLILGAFGVGVGTIYLGAKFAGTLDGGAAEGVGLPLYVVEVLL
jgi:hypothetical protein